MGRRRSCCTDRFTVLCSAGVIGVQSGSGGRRRGFTEPAVRQVWSLHSVALTADGPLSLRSRGHRGPVRTWAPAAAIKRVGIPPSPQFQLRLYGHRWPPRKQFMRRSRTMPLKIPRSPLPFQIPTVAGVYVMAIVAHLLSPKDTPREPKKPPQPERPKEHQREKSPTPQRGIHL